jgi:Ni,Fe-hydrogenase maturation factor
MQTSKNKKIFVFGNEDLEIDNLPLRILPELATKFPNIEFVVKDPNEEWDVENEDELIILDTTVGIKEITVFDNLEKFSKVPRVGMHDFDALTNLRFLQKLGKIKKVKIIAVPQDLNEKAALSKISDSVASVILCL